MAEHRSEVAVSVDILIIVFVVVSFVIVPPVAWDDSPVCRSIYFLFRVALVVHILAMFTVVVQFVEW